jgi:hypothetical protein
VDPDYAPDKDGEANTKQTRVPKKSKVAAVDTPKPNAAKPIKQWTKMENEQLQLGLVNYGNNYSKLKELFFQNDDSVKPKDINNHISNTPELKRIQQSNLSKDRDKKLAEFQKSVAAEKSIVPQNISTTPSILVSDIHIDRPKSVGGKEYVIPDESFLYFQPFMKSTPNHYVYFQRRYLTTKINVDYDEEKSYLIWDFIDQPQLLEEELFETKLIKKYPKISEVPFSSPTRSFQSITVVPEDAMLETTTRYDSDTPNGALLEIWIERRIRRDKSSLKAPNSNLKISTTTTRPLMPSQNSFQPKFYPHNNKLLPSSFPNHSESRKMKANNTNNEDNNTTIHIEDGNDDENNNNNKDDDLDGLIVKNGNESNDSEEEDYNGPSALSGEDEGGSIHTSSDGEKYEEDNEYAR